MATYTCQNAILFLTFNRLDTTKRVFSEICRAKPPRIYLASDGARNAQESRIIESIRAFLLENISWDCEVKTRFLKNNLGCKKAVSSAISWFFAHESQGIILEDDCLPNGSFFRFLDEILARYANDSRIFMASGWSALDFAPKAKDALETSYFFSKYNHIWGWASWARAWEKYELENSAWERDFNAMKFDSWREKWHCGRIFREYFKGNIDTWDYPMTFCVWKNRMLCVYPRENMVQNIGFNRSDATHTSGESKFENMAVFEMNFPLIHPPKVARNVAFDKLNYRITFAPPPFLWRVVRKLKRILF